MRPGRVQIRPQDALAGLSGGMILFSVIASVVGTVLLNLLLWITQGDPPSRPIVGNDWRHEMRTTTKRRAGQPALVHGGGAGRRLGVGAGRPPRQGADFVQRFGRGPMADRLRQRPVTTVTWRQP